MAIPGLMHLPLLDLRYQDPSKTTINLEEDIIIYLHQTWFIDKKRDQNKKHGIVMDCPKIEDAPTIVFFTGNMKMMTDHGDLGVLCRRLPSFSIRLPGSRHLSWKSPIRLVASNQTIY